MKCSLCGYQGENCSNSCQGCPLACGKKKCPNCGCEILPESYLEKAAKKVLNFWKRRKENGTNN